MAFVQHYRPSTVQICCCTEVDVADYHVDESSKVFLASSSCHEVVASRDGEQVKDIRANTFKESYSFMS